MTVMLIEKFFRGFLYSKAPNFELLSLIVLSNLAYSSSLIVAVVLYSTWNIFHCKYKFDTVIRIGQFKTCQTTLHLNVTTI